MNSIILQVCQQFISEIVDFFNTGNAISLVEMEKGLQKSSDKFLREVLKAYLEGIDREIAEDKTGRKKKGLVVERRDEERTVYTRFGEITYSRSYYFDKRKKAYTYPVDQVVGLEAYQRVSHTVAADLVAHAAESSYGESSRHVTGGEISRQTVMKIVRRTHGLRLPAPEEKRKVKILHIDADEDHVALQNGSNTIVPIVTVHEGVERVSKGRNRCVNAHHICAYEKKSEDLWREVAEWIYDAYDVDSLESVYIHGDGAHWIKTGLEEIPKSKAVLDKYHINKSIMKSTGAQPNHRQALRWALKDADQQRFKKIIRAMVKAAKSDNELERIHEFQRYVLNNWRGIEIYKTEKCGGSSAEGHVSHVLSARMSSRPMGWSHEGIKFMARLRAFRASGGVVGVEHLQSKAEVSSLIKKGIKRAQSIFHGITPETLGNIASKNIGKVTPLFKIMRSIQHGGFLVQ